jgi:hypothetical protein
LKFTISSSSSSSSSAYKLSKLYFWRTAFGSQDYYRMMNIFFCRVTPLIVLFSSQERKYLLPITYSSETSRHGYIVRYSHLRPVANTNRSVSFCIYIVHTNVETMLNISI